MTDVSQSLRDEERQAWQRLIRVIGHEINNSLAPIKSIAHSLERILSRDPKPPDWETDMRGGLQVIGARADSLGRFTAAYAQLARLPAPTLRAVRLGHAGGARRGPRASHDGDGRPADRASRSRPIPISSNSFSSTCCATPWTQRSTTAGGVTVSWELVDGRVRAARR